MRTFLASSLAIAIIVAAVPAMAQSCSNCGTAQPNFSSTVAQPIQSYSGTNYAPMASNGVYSAPMSYAAPTMRRSYAQPMPYASPVQYLAPLATTYAAPAMNRSYSPTIQYTAQAQYSMPMSYPTSTYSSSPIVSAPAKAGCGCGCGTAGKSCGCGH